MKILQCPDCGAKFDVSRFQPGKKVRCGRCKSVILVPDEGEPAVQAQTEAEAQPAAPPAKRSPTRAFKKPVQARDEEDEDSADNGSESEEDFSGDADSEAPAQSRKARRQKYAVKPREASKKTMLIAAVSVLAICGLGVAAYVVLSQDAQQDLTVPKWIVDKRAEFTAKYETTNRSSADSLFELHMWAAQWPEALGKESEDLLDQVMKLNPGHVNGLNRVKAVHTDKLLEARGADSEQGWLALAEFCNRFGLIQECAYAAEFALKRNPANTRAKEFVDRIKKKETESVEEEMAKELAEAQAEAEKLGPRGKRINELCGDVYRDIFGVVPVWEWEKRETYREGKAKGWSLRDYKPYVIFLEEGSYSADTVFEWIYGNIEKLSTQFRAAYPDAIKPEASDEDFVGVFIFKDRESYLEKTGVKEYAAAFYSPQKRALMVPNDPDVGERDKVLFHEGIHQLVDFTAGYGRGGRPFWFEEGMATHFEALGRTGSDGDPLTRVGSERYLTGIKAAIRDKKHKPLSEMLGMSYGTGQSSDEQRGINYSQSWSIVYFLYNFDGGKYRGKWKEYVTAELTGRGGVKTFSDLFGDVGAIEKVWLEYMPQVMSN